MLGGFITEANFNPIDAIHTWITSWSTAKNFDACSGEKSKMGQIMAHFVGQIDALHHACTANLRVAQSCNVHGSHIRPSWSSLLYDNRRIFAGLWQWLGIMGINRGFREYREVYGAPGRIRTSDLLVRSQALYPAELRAHIALLQLTKNNR